jgi:phytoene dehydrogenase-like protein
LETPHIVIIGAGMAGLACAVALQREGISYELFDGADAPGGRVRTDQQDGYRLDRGFQILLTAYPAVRNWLNPRDLDLRAFQPGALVRIGDSFQPFHDVSRLPGSFFATAFSRVGSLSDKLRLRSLQKEVQQGEWQALFKAPEKKSSEFLRERGFSDQVIQRFFRPFFAGVFLDPALETSSRMLTFTLRMFAQGAAALPARGMESIVSQLAGQLYPEAIHLGKRVSTVFRGRIVFEGGGSMMARRIVLATDGTTAAKLCPAVRPPVWRMTNCFYYGFEGKLRNGGFLMLNGDGKGPINHAAILSEVVPEYAPRGRSLVCANTAGPTSLNGKGLEAAVRAQLANWLKVRPEKLQFLRNYDIPRALPYPAEGPLEQLGETGDIGDGIYVAGDHRAHPSLQGAMDSGIAVARRIISEVKESSASDWLD